MTENNSRRNCFKLIVSALVLVSLAYLILVSEIGLKLRTRLLIKSENELFFTLQKADEAPEVQTESLPR